MDEEVLSQSTRKFLRKLGVTTQRELEAAIREAIDAGTLEGDETLDVTATVIVGGITREIVVPGRIQLA